MAELLRRNMPDFISPLLWSPNSLVLNPVNYKMWRLLQQEVYRSIQTVEELRQRRPTLDEWNLLDQRVIDSAVKQWSSLSVAV